MSTRGMIGIRVNGTLMGTYNHSDSYPDGLGLDIVKFVQASFLTQEQIATFKANVKTLKVVNSQDAPDPDAIRYYLDRDPDPSLGMTRAMTEYYSLLRQYQGVAGLSAIMTGELKHWIDGADFIEESLFCEYAYILDLDAEVMEFYVGFQATGTMETRTAPNGRTYEAEKYDPCKLVGTLPFAGVTVEAMMAFYAKEEVEEEDGE